MTRGMSPRVGAAGGRVGAADGGVGAGDRVGAADGGVARDRRISVPLTLSGGLASTITLGAVTVVTAIGMSRLFQGSSYLVPLLVVAVLSHAVSFGLRRTNRFPPVLVGPACMGVVLAVSTWLVFPGATALGLPDLHTLKVISQSLARARVDFDTLTTPVPATPGFLWLAALATGATGALADATAFRLGAPVEGILPAFAVFLFTAGLGTSTGRSAAVGVWLAAALIYLLVAEVERRASRVDWMSNGGPPALSLFPAGLALAGVALLGALLIGPALPGARAGSLVNSKARSSGSASARTTISPLVNIKAELLQPSTAAVFTVSSPVASYWRLTALDNFDGTVWSADDTYQPAGPALPSAPGPESTTAAAQQVHITGLAEAWLPAAFLPVALSGVSGAGFDPASASIIAGSPTREGLTYTVTSHVPDFTTAELASVSDKQDSPTSTQDLELPATLPASVRSLAKRVTAGAATPYEKALALQSFFRDNFTYSLNVPASNADNALVGFLFHTRKGYCQQFAGAYAVMARAIGLPSRVAVGFTPGQLGSDGLYHVEALNAHAWPEVELGRFGWVAFEPTPGRGEPGATGYTGVTAAQAHPRAAPATSATTPPATTPGSIAPPVTAPARSPAAPAAGAGRGAGQRHHTRGLGTLAILGLVLVGIGFLLGLALGTVAALGMLRRRRRWARSPGRYAIVAAVSDAGEALAWAGRPRHPAETFIAYAHRVGPDLPPGAAPALLSLARIAEYAAYAPPDASPSGQPEISVLRELHDTIILALRRDLSPTRRLLWWVDPRAQLGPKRTPGWTRSGPGLLVRDSLRGPRGKQVAASTPAGTRRPTSGPRGNADSPGGTGALAAPDPSRD